MTVVSNSTPLIHLSALGDLFLVPELFSTILIPPAVYREGVLEGEGQPGTAEVRAAVGMWLTVNEPLDEQLVQVLATQADLHAVETEAILLAKQLGAEALLMDDQAAVAFARSRGIDVVRTPALYLAAKRRGYLDLVRPELDALRHSRFRLRDRDYEAILQLAGEL